MIELLSYLKHARRNNESLARDVTGWDIYESSLSNYAISFSGLITIDELYQLVAFQRERTGKFTALDLMGNGVAIEELNPDLVVGTILEKQNTNQATKQRILLSGDLLAKKTWGKIDHTVRSHQIIGFDLITCRPKGGITLLPDLPHLLIYFYHRACNMLNPGGIMLAQLLGLMSRATENDKQLIESSLAHPGLSIQFQPADGILANIAAVKATRY